MTGGLKYKLGGLSHSKFPSYAYDYN